MLGFHQLGELALDEIEAGVPISATFEPGRGAAARYEEMFKQFVKVFRRNRAVFRALNVGSE